MLKRRGGQRQKRKEADVWAYHRDPERGASAKGVGLLAKYGWEEGKGLGNGGGRIGRAWGLVGHYVERTEIVNVHELTWTWSYTSLEGAEYAFSSAGLDFNQVLIIFFFLFAKYHLCSTSQKSFSPSTGGNWSNLPRAGAVVLSPSSYNSSTAPLQLALGRDSSLQKVLVVLLNTISLLLPFQVGAERPHFDTRQVLCHVTIMLRKAWQRRQLSGNF